MNTNFITQKKIYFFILLSFFFIYINNYVLCRNFFLIRYILNIFFSFLCFFLFKYTSLGKKIFLYFIKSKLEISQIYWPSKYEVIKTVIVVFILSFLISILIWMFDNFLLYIISFIISLRFN